MSLGKSAYHLCFTVNTQKKRIGAEIYINDDKELFYKFKEQQENIEKTFGAKMEWIEATKACRILATTSGDIKKGQDGWTSLFDWYMDAAVKLKNIALQYDN